MGPDGFTTIDAAGQSFLRLDAYHLTVGVSHENVIVGPARRNPIVMSASASGFAHAFAGVQALDVWIARIDAMVLAGHVDESAYFDARPGNDRSGIATWTFALRPRWLDGLEVG